MSNPSDKKNASLLNLLSALHRHHKYLFIYSLFLVTLAMVVPSLSGLSKKQISIPELNILISHPPYIILFITILLISSFTFTLIGATHGKFWIRFFITSIVSFLLLVFGSIFFALHFILVPVMFMISYVLWRGLRPIPGHPSIKDMVIISLTVVGIFGIVFAIAFGFRLPSMGMIETLYIVIAQLIALAVFLPMPLIFLSGIDLANMTDKIVERMTTFCSQKGNNIVLVTLLSTSIVKLGFNLYKIEWNSISSLIASVIFLVLFLCMGVFTPTHLLHFKPQFKHWIVISAIILPVPIGVMGIMIMLGAPVPIDTVSIIVLGLIGPICLVSAGILSCFQKRRPFSIFLAFMGIWVLLTSTVPVLGKLDLGIIFDGLTLWSLDGLAALIFIIWSSWLFYQRKSSPLVSTALKFSFFLSCCFVLDQLLNNKVAIAELYTIFQAITFLVIHQFINRPKQVWWIQAFPWLLVVIMLVHNIWSGILPGGVMNSVKLAILTIAMLWDIVMSEEKISGKKIIGPHQPGLLFIYLGVVTWTVAQVVYAKTGKGVGFLEWEPVLLFGFLTLGVPWLLYLLLMEIKTKLSDQASKK